jgi:hypothetical protein
MYQIPKIKSLQKDQFKRFKKSRVTKTTVKKIDCKYIRPQRAGVILYSKSSKFTIFSFGVDSKSHELTDFGGGVEYNKRKENAIEGALREFNEETLDIFATLKYEDIMDCNVIYDENNLIIFIPINEKIETINYIFNKKYQETNINGKIAEVCNIRWLSNSELNLALDTPGVIFNRVRKFILSAGEIDNLLP